ncbi:MAG: flagellin [Planctomycetota bacterium]|nr:MAG: flagellin [Planctomycetota bacterium]
MSRINTNVQSLIAQRVLNQNNQALSLSLERLSTGLRINRGGDDPAGLIASQNLRAEKAGLGAAIGNAERAEQVVNIAEGGLQEVSGLLTDLEGLITATANTAGLSAEEKEANQLQIDSILQTIDRIADATSFQGSKLLNGNFGFETTNVSANVADFKINGAKLEFGQTRDVDILVTQSAQRAGFFVSVGGALDLGSAGETFVIEVGGAKGSRELSFASGAALADIVAAINSFTDITGVSAATSGGGFRVDSTDFGTSESVSIKINDTGNIVSALGAGIIGLAATDTAAASAATGVGFTATGASNGLQDTGQDVGATINGVVATTKGTKASISTDFLSVEIDLTATAAQTPAALNALTISGGGADFQLASNVDIAGKVSIGLDNVAARNVGKVTDNGSTFTLADLAGGKALNVENGDLANAQKVVSQAIKDVSSLRGRIGAFQKNTIGATIRSLGVALENTTAAESAIRDADFAAETAGLTRNQILAQSATNVLSIANAQPQNVLALLG